MSLQLGSDIAKAIAAGSDPRSVEALKKSLLSAYTTPKISRIGGKAQHISGRVKAREKAVAEQTQKAKNILLEKGLSSYYVRICHEAYQKNIITAQRLAEILLIEENELKIIFKLSISSM